MHLKSLFVPFFIIIVPLFFYSALFAQKEGNIWYFGDLAGVDFNSGMATAITDGALQTNEGCASRSDANGNLLFYTDGRTVYNKNHAVMENGDGLYGNASSTQSGVIVNKPGSVTEFYVFVVDFQAGFYSENPVFTFSLVDMNLNGGLGAVTSEKNITIQDFACEKVMAVPHANGKDYWIITHEWNSDVYANYLLTENGLDTNPVFCALGAYVGIEQDPVGNASIGYLKSNQLGNKIVSVHSFAGYVDVMDFDNQTGVLSNALTMEFDIVGDIQEVPYGAEFSPDGHYLYIGWGYPGTIYQYDLTNNTAESLQGSEKLVPGSNGNELGGALQLAPDGFIYQSLTRTGYLGAIYNPDESAVNLNYNNEALFLDGREAVFGLPTFVSNISYVPTEIIVSTAGNCIGDSTEFILNNTSFDSVEWTFGDIPSGARNTSNAISPKHKYPNYGDYYFTVTAYKDTVVLSYSDLVRIHDLPTVFLGVDTALCENDNLILDAADVGTSSYAWQDGSDDSIFVVTEPGVYSVEVTNSHGCINFDAITVDQIPTPIIDLGPDTGFCHGESLELDVQLIGEYLWSTSDVSQSIMVSNPGEYSVVFTDVDTKCKARDTINLVEYNSDLLPSDTIVCTDAQLKLFSLYQAVTYEWSTGETTDTIEVATSGKYYLEAVFGSGCAFSDTINVQFNHRPKVNLGNDTVLCDGEKLTLDAGIGDAYDWSTNESTQTIEVSEVGFYRVDVAHAGGCVVSDSIQVDFLKMPDLGNDTILCENETLILDAGREGISYDWNTGEVSQSITVSDSGRFIVSVELTASCIVKDSILISIENQFLNLLGEDTVICKEATLTLSTSVTGSSYLWSTGENTPTIDVEEEGEYRIVFLSDNLCAHYDSISVSEFAPNNLEDYAEACNGDSVLLDGNNTGITYTWSTGAISDTIFAKTSGLYKLIATNKDGCQSEDSTMVHFNPNPEFEILPKDSNLCTGDTVLFYSSLSEGKMQWSVSSNNNMVSLWNNTELTLSITNNFGCTSTDTNNVFFNLLPVIDFKEYSLFCVGDNKVLDAGNPTATFLWNTGSTSQSITAVDRTFYSVVVTSDKGCIDSNSTEIRYLDVPEISLALDTTYCLGDEVELNVYSPFASYAWYDGSTRHNNMVSTDGVYTVEVSNICGTTLNTSNVEFIFCDCVLQIPNSFTPNSDGFNDNFEVVSNCVNTDFLIRIFDRWGQTLFESSDPYFTWDGKTQSGTEVQIGIYNFVIVHQYGDVDRREETGVINLIR